MLCSCKSNNREFFSIDVLSSPDGEIRNLSEIATDIHYIPLQTTENSLISSIYSIKVKGEFIYINTLENIHCFDYKGKYLFSLDMVGRGPGEYRNISDFDVNANNTKLIITSGRKMLLYNLISEGIKFDKDLKVKRAPWRISFTGETDRILIQYSNADGSSIYSNEVIDINGESLVTWPNYSKFVPIDGFVVTNLWETITFIQNDQIYVKELLNDTLFCLINDSVLKPTMIFNTGKKRLTPKVRSKGREYFDRGSDYLTVPKILSSERYLYYIFSYKESGPGNKIIFDKMSGRKFVVPGKDGLVDNLLGGIDFMPEYCYNGIFISWIEASKLKSYVSGNVFNSTVATMPEKKDELRVMADSLSEFDNPVLIVVNVR